jgi:hypothetical protein
VLKHGDVDRPGLIRVQADGGRELRPTVAQPPALAAGAATAAATASTSRSFFMRTSRVG